jgi:hypothetical protein
MTYFLTTYAGAAPVLARVPFDGLDAVLTWVERHVAAPANPYVALPYTAEVRGGRIDAMKLDLAAISAEWMTRNVDRKDAAVTLVLIESDTAAAEAMAEEAAERNNHAAA